MGDLTHREACLLEDSSHVLNLFGMLVWVVQACPQIRKPLLDSGGGIVRLVACSFEHRPPAKGLAFLRFLANGYVCLSGDFFAVFARDTKGKPLIGGVLNFDDIYIYIMYIYIYIH